MAVVILRMLNKNGGWNTRIQYCDNKTMIFFVLKSQNLGKEQILPSEIFFLFTWVVTVAFPRHLTRDGLNVGERVAWEQG